MESQTEPPPADEHDPWQDGDPWTAALNSSSSPPPGLGIQSPPDQLPVGSARPGAQCPSDQPVDLPGFVRANEALMHAPCGHREPPTDSQQMILTLASNDPLFSQALHLTQLYQRACSMFRFYYPWALAFVLGISLSLSLAGLLLPSHSSHLTEHARILDGAFNASVASFVSSQICEISDFDSPFSWSHYLLRLVSLSSHLDPDCESVSRCLPAIRRLESHVRPSALIAHHSTPLRVVSTRVWIESRVSRAYASVTSYVSDGRSRIIALASDHAVTLLGVYMLFPSRALLSVTKLLLRVSRGKG